MIPSGPWMKETLNSVNGCHTVMGLIFHPAPKQCRAWSCLTSLKWWWREMLACVPRGQLPCGGRAHYRLSCPSREEELCQNRRYGFPSFPVTKVFRFVLKTTHRALGVGTNRFIRMLKVPPPLNRCWCWWKRVFPPSSQRANTIVIGKLCWTVEFSI